MHPGGIADKVGNRYEAVWLIRHLVQLIDGRATAITIEALGDQGVGFEFSLADGWVKHAPVNAGRILTAILENWYRHHDTGTPFGDEAHHVHRDFYHFNELTKADPVTALRSVIPAMRVAMDRTEVGDERPSEDRLWCWRRKDRGAGPHVVEFIDMVRSALQKVAANEPERVADLLDPLDPRRHMTALHLLLEAISANRELAQSLKEQADNPGLFKAGWHHADAFSAGTPDVCTIIQGSMGVSWTNQTSSS